MMEETEEATDEEKKVRRPSFNYGGMKEKGQHALLKRRTDQETQYVFWETMEEQERKDEQGTSLISCELHARAK